MLELETSTYAQAHDYLCSITHASVRNMQPREKTLTYRTPEALFGPHQIYLLSLASTLCLLAATLTSCVYVFLQLDLKSSVSIIVCLSGGNCAV